MGFEEGAIILDRDDSTYYSGQIVKGRLQFELSKEKTFRGIYINFKGFCKVHWTSSRTRRENDRQVNYTVSHDSYEEYVNITIYLVGSKSGEHKLHPGLHVFPFEFQIPLHCPSSFDGSDGHVTYEVKATVDRAFKVDQHKHAYFRVIAPLDLNQNPYAQEGIGIEFFNSYCCWCVSAGKTEITVKVPAGGAVPGQVVPVEVACSNDSSVEIDAIRLQLKKEVTFHAEYESDTRHAKDKILEVKKGPVPGRTSRSWVVELPLPQMDVHNMTGCRFIEVDYKFQVKVETSGCHTDDEESRPFIIGTIPLAAFNNLRVEAQENNPVSHGVSPYPPNQYPNPNAYPPAMNAPQNSPYPAPYPNQGYPGTNPTNTMYPPPQGTSPYPPSNAPYPNASPNPPYPPNTSPYPPNPSQQPPNPSQQPPNSTPYPPNASPYSPNATPYPPNPSQQPPNSTPYPPNASPYPPNATPYPPNSTPYPPNPPQPTNYSPYPPNPSQQPTVSPPYPPNSTPYPPSTSPYPPNSSPYPPASAPYGNSPKPEFTGTTLLKTGNIGFTAHGNDSKAETMPLLPPLAAPNPPSAYATASAPAPSTPDVVGNDLSNVTTNTSPYPEFKDKPEGK